MIFRVWLGDKRYREGADGVSYDTPTPGEAVRMFARDRYDAFGQIDPGWVFVRYPNGECHSWRMWIEMSFEVEENGGTAVPWT